MTSRAQHLYLAVFQKIKELNSNVHPRILMCDFEQPIRSAFTECFGHDSAVRGCYFHFTQAVLKKVSKMHLSGIYRQSESVRNSVRKLLVLPLLQPHQIAPAFESVRMENADYLDQLYRYFQLQWIERVGTDEISVNGLDDRTNNGMEGINAYLLSKIGSKPGFWDFLRRITSVVRKYDSDLSMHAGGMNIRRLQ